MHKTSLLEILRTFSPEEIKKFEDFLSSPYFNKKSGPLKLYKHIKKYAPELNTPKLEREKVWNALYKGKEFNYGVFKNLIYDLTHLAEKFIAFEDYVEENHFDLRLRLLNSLKNRQLKKLFLSKFNTVKKDIDSLYKSKKFIFELYCSTLSELYLIKFYFSRDFDKHSRMGDELNELITFSTSSFLYDFLMKGFDSLSFSKNHIYNKQENLILSFFEKKDSTKLILQLIESLKSKSTEAYNFLSVCFKYYESIFENSSKKYFDFKKVLMTNAGDFSKSDLSNFYIGLGNSCTLLISPEFNKSKELLDIKKLRIRDELIVDPDGFVSTIDFVSTINIALHLEDLNFVESFAEKFIKYLPKNTRESMKKYTLANLFFIKKEFEKSLEQISTINYDIIHLKPVLTNLQAMNHYELNNYNSFLLLFDSYKHFLSKNKNLVERIKDLGKLLVKYIDSLFKLRENFDEFELKNLKNRITLSIVPQQEWLFRKVEELERKSNTQSEDCSYSR